MLIEIVIVVAVVLTSMLSGVLGMAGGILLMALLVSLKSIAAAMIIHGVVQANVERLARVAAATPHRVSKILPPYLVGAALSFGCVRERSRCCRTSHWVMIAIGAFPWIALVVPKLNGLDVTRPATAVVCGSVGDRGAAVRRRVGTAARLLLSARAASTGTRSSRTRR